MNFNREFAPALVGQCIVRRLAIRDDSETVQIQPLCHGLLNAGKPQVGILVLGCERQQELASARNGCTLNLHNARP